MDLTVLRTSLSIKKRSSLALGGLLALTACAGSMQAANTLLNTPVVSNPSVGVTCNTQTGIGAPQTITVTPKTASTASTSVIVTLAAQPAGLTVSPAGGGTLNLGTTQLVFTVNAAPGCVNLSATPNFANAIQFKTQETGTVVALSTDATASVISNLTVVTSSTPLMAPAVTINCGYSATAGPGNTPLWVPSSTPQTISITSVANGGTPFTVTNSNAFLNLSAAGGTAGGASSPATITATLAAGCGALTVTTPETITLTPTGGGEVQTVTITVKIVSLSPLTATPSPAAPSIAMTYVKFSGSPGSVTVDITSSTVSATFFSINTATLPIWLTVNPYSGTASTTKTQVLTFTTTSVCDSMAPGSYSATIDLLITGYGDLPVTIGLEITNKAPKLSVSSTPNLTCSGSNATAIANCADSILPVTWTYGSQTSPTTSITVSSNDSPIQYTVTSGGPLAPMVTAPASGLTQSSGVAYSFGTQIPISFPASVTNALQPGSIVSGTMTFTWGTPASTTVVTITLTVTSAGATITSAFPASLPTAVPGVTPFTVSLVGTGFVAKTGTAIDATQATRVGIVGGGLIATDTNITISVINPSNATLTITVPTTTDCPNLPFSPTTPCSGTIPGGNIYIGVVNGQQSNTATGTITIPIGNGPVIQGVSSSSSFVEPTAPNIPTIAPYDMISIFGANFCSSLNTGCASNTVLTGSPLGAASLYPTTLSPDVPPYVAVSPTNIRNAYVQFSLSVTPFTVIGTAPLLFVSNTQINAIVPAGIFADVGAGTVNINVFFGYGTSATTLLQSNSFKVNVAATDPGIFTIGSDGQGSAAALNGAYALISSTNPAGMRTTTNSDIVALYVTGLGIPDSAGITTAALSGGGGTTAVAPADCVTPGLATTPTVGGYLADLIAASGNANLTTIDGAIVQSALLNGHYPPCMLAAQPVVNIGGVPSTVAYAGFVDDTVAGLYQINVKLPSTSAANLVDINNNPIALLTGPATLPVTVAFGGQTSQPGVTLNVMPRISVAAPTVTCTPTTCEVGKVWPTSASAGFVASLSPTSSNYTYAVTSGVLPAGLSLNTTTGMISGTPTANGSQLITVTAYDSSAIPLTGTVTYTVPVSAGLYLTETADPTTTFLNGSIMVGPTITPTSGVGPFTFSTGTTGFVTNPTSTATAQTGVIDASIGTQGGTYSVAVTATDQNGLTGSLTVPVVIALRLDSLSALTTTSIASSTGVTVATMNAHGYSGLTPTCTASIPGLLCSLPGTGGSLVTITTSGSPALLAGPHNFTITVTDDATATGSSAEAVGTSSQINWTIVN